MRSAAVCQSCAWKAGAACDRLRTPRQRIGSRWSRCRPIAVLPAMAPSNRLWAWAMRDHDGTAPPKGTAVLPGSVARWSIRRPEPGVQAAQLQYARTCRLHRISDWRQAEGLNREESGKGLVRDHRRDCNHREASWCVRYFAGETRAALPRHCCSEKYGSTSTTFRQIQHISMVNACGMWKSYTATAFYFVGSGDLNIMKHIRW